MSGPEVEWQTGTAGQPSPEGQAPVRRRTWGQTLAAAVVGVVASVAASLVVAALLPSLSQGATVLAGLAVGTIVAGVILRARGLLGWLGAAGLVLATQFLLGLVLVLIFRPPL